MNFKAAIFGLIASALLAVGPVSAHGSSSHAAHTRIVPTYCSEYEYSLSDYGAYSRVVSKAGHGFIYQGGIHDENEVGGKYEFGIGFQLQNPNIVNFAFKSTTAGNGFPEVYYVVDDGNGGVFADDAGVVKSTNGKGVTRWTFNRKNSGLPKTQKVVIVIFEDFGNYGNQDFDDTGYEFFVNGLGVPLRGALIQDCGEYNY